MRVVTLCRNVLHHVGVIFLVIAPRSIFATACGSIWMSSWRCIVPTPWIAVLSDLIKAGSECRSTDKSWAICDTIEFLFRKEPKARLESRGVSTVYLTLVQH